MARHELDRTVLNRSAEDIEGVMASEQFELWYFGLLLLQMCTKNAPTLWQCDQADNILDDSDLRLAAYFWDSIKLERIGKIPEKWEAAADLVLWCLQAVPSRRPQNMQQVLAHKFFDAACGTLRFLTSPDEAWKKFMQRRAADLHAAITEQNRTRLRELITASGAGFSMIDQSIYGSTVLLLHRAAFAGGAEVMRMLLVEISDGWPEDVKRQVLDCRTRLDSTPLMIASHCGHIEVAELLKDKGCSIHLANASGKSAEKILHDFQHELEWACVRPWNRGDILHLSTRTVEAFLVMQSDSRNEHVRAGKRLWSSKLVVHHLNTEQMLTLEAEIEALIEHGFSIAALFFWHLFAPKHPSQPIL